MQLTNARAREGRVPPVDYVRAFSDEFDFVYRALRRHGITSNDAEDLAQEVFLVTWRRWSHFDPGRPLRPWLAGIAFRVAYNHLQRRREVPGGTPEAPDDAPRPDEQLMAARARSLVRLALARLPDKYREPVVLADLDGVSMTELADVLSVRLVTAYTRLRRGREAFAREVERLQKLQPSAPSAAQPVTQKARALIAPATLVALEREPLHAPAGLKRRVMERLEKISLPEAGALALPSSGTAAWLPTALKIGALGAAAALAVVAWRAHAPHPAGAEAAGALPGLSELSAAQTQGRPTLAGLRPRDLIPTAMPRDISGESLARDLAGYWRFDESAGTTTARDLSGRGRDCAIKNMDPSAVWTGGAMGNGLHFSGTGWLECPENDAPAANEMTVAAWVKRARRRPQHRAIITREDPNNQDDYFFGFYGDVLKISSHAWRALLTRSFPDSTRGWHHVAFSHASDGTTALYIDGAEVARQQTQPNEPVRGPRRLMIGAGYNSHHMIVRQQLEGTLDELAIFERALGPAEIAALAAGARPTPK